MDNLLLLNKRKRIKEIDIIRGICILLMIFDHFILFYYNAYPDNTSNKILFEIYEFANIYLSNNWRIGIRFVVMSIFFILSGICCSFSRNNLKRGLKILIASMFITLATYTITKYTEYNILIICGVLHCYAIYVIIYNFVSTLSNNTLTYVNVFLGSLLISLLFIALNPKANSNAFIYFGIPYKYYIAPFEYVSPPKWIWAFFLGVLAGKTIYKTGNSLFSYDIPVITFIGKHSIWLYFIHFTFIYIVLKIIF